MRRPLAPNPEGVARLDRAVAAVRQAPQRKPVDSLPQRTRTVSGQTFVFAPNAAEIRSLRLQFDDSATAVVDIELFGSPQRHRWPVGLDGVYRMSKGPYGAPQGIRGFWADSQTFVFEYDWITSNDHKMFSMRFERDRVAVEVREIAYELGAQFEGRLQQPVK